MNNKGFTLIEVFAVIAIICILSMIVISSVFSIRGKARDARRKVEIAQIGRLLSLSCYVPDSGGGEYDLMDVIDEIKAAYPQYVKFLPVTPKDPKSGTDLQSFYRYVVDNDGEDCALYANLENESDDVTLESILAPTPGGGTGIFEAAGDGWNGTPKYFQVSN